MGLVTALAIGGAACNGNSTTMDTGPADTGPTDAATDMGTGNCDDAGHVMLPPDGGPSAANCYRVQPCDMQPFCPNLATNDPMHPAFLMQQIDVSRPTSLSGTSIRHILNNALVTGSFGWGIKLDLTANTITTGALQPGPTPQPGVGLYQSTFMFDMGNAPAGDAGSANRWDPVMSSVTLTGDTFSTGMISLITTPVYNTDGSVLTELPLRDASMHDVIMTSNRNCIGLALGNFPFNSCIDGRWLTSMMGSSTSYGVLEANITVADAMNVQIVSLNTTLCNLLAGSMCDSTPQAMWMNQPDTMTGGATMPNAWHLVANFAAVAIHITP